MHAVPCITLTRAMSNLTQLQKLTYGLVMREDIIPDDPENILEVLVDTLGKLVNLKEVTISRFRGVSSDAMARILRCAIVTVASALQLICSIGHFGISWGCGCDDS